MFAIACKNSNCPALPLLNQDRPLCARFCTPPYRAALALQCFARSGTATARIRSRLHLVQQACIRTQLHLALAAVRCPQLVQPPSAAFRCCPQALKNPHSLWLLPQRECLPKSMHRAATRACAGKDAPGDRSCINALVGRTIRCIFVISASLSWVIDWRLALLFCTFGVNSVGTGECIISSATSQHWHDAWEGSKVNGSNCKFH